MPDWREALRARLASADLDPSDEADVIDELAQHLDDRYRELRAAGLPSGECRRLALAELGDGDRLARGARLRRRAAGRAPSFGIPGRRAAHLQDLRIACRRLRAQPWFSLFVIGMLAFGIGGDAAMFSLFDGLFLRPLPFTQSDRLMALDETAAKWNLKYVGVSVPDAHAWRGGSSTFSGMAFFAGASYNLVDGGAARRVEGAQVTHDMLEVLGLTPAVGRGFRPEEDGPAAAKVVLLGYDLWRRAFHGDRGAVGRVVTLDERPYTVIGVLPPAAILPNRTDVWTPLAADPNRPSGYFLNGIGRLRGGVSVEQARADLARIHKGLIAQGRTVNAITSPVVMPLGDRYLGQSRTISVVLLGAVSLVLLMTCANITALMIARGAARSREIAIRTALGASHARIVVQLMTESLVTATLAGIAGVALAVAGLRGMVAWMPDGLPRWISFSLDWRFAIFCVAMTGGATLLFGIATALETWRIDIRGSLQDSASRATASRSRRALFGALVVCEVGLAVMLSVAAALLVQGLRHVLAVDPGFRPVNVLTFGVSLPDATYGRPEQRIAYYEHLLARLKRLPGVQAVGATSAPPLGGHWGGQFEAEGRPVVALGQNPVVLRIAATPGYFEAIGTTLLKGRTFEPQDGSPGGALVALVNETFARHFWSDARPVGKRIRPSGSRDWYEVIGLVRDERHDGLDREAPPAVFLPYATAVLRADRDDFRSLRPMTIVVRGVADPMILVAPVREAVRQLDPDVPVYAVETMTARLERSLWARRAYSSLIGALAIIAIVLAAAGVYGIVSFTVSQRTHEIGIRLALGAAPGQVLRRVLAGGMLLVSIGVAAGVIGSIGVSRLLGALLFGVSSRDPVIYTASAAGLTAVGLLANLVPARRAASTDPTSALRVE